jgi:CheY-like chemotaxis protein
MTTALSGLRLLLVEDEALVAMMAEDMLIDLGCVVADVAGTVSRGVALVGELALDGAILDVNLGGEKVYPVAQALAERGIPFIFATGYGTTGIAEAFSHVPVLAKPYEAGALERMLTAALPASGQRGAAPTG